MQKINIKCAFALALQLVCSFAEAHAAAKKKTKAIRPTYGRIEVTASYPERPTGSTNTYPILVNGKQMAMTAPDLRDAQVIDLQPGQYTVEVVFPNRTHRQVINVVAGKRHCICLTYSERKRPCPPYTVSVSAPTSVAEGSEITFSSEVAYGGSAALSYTWTISPGGARIVSDQGLPTITVDTDGLGNQPITATLVVDDGSGDPACPPQRAQVSTDVIREIPAVIFDRVPPVTYDDLKARLDNLAIELQNTPNAQGYIFVYTAPTSRPGQYERLAKRVEDYMVRQRGIDMSRLVILNGGNRDTDFYEFWIVPQGAKPPQASPSVTPGYVAPAQPSPNRRTRRSRRDE
jgi:hypothetical protein